MEKYNGKVLIADGKINILDIKIEDRPLSEIQQLIVLRNIVQKHLEHYELHYKRS